LSYTYDAGIKMMIGILVVSNILNLQIFKASKTTRSTAACQNGATWFGNRPAFFLDNSISDFQEFFW
jgi:hypothetical protein